MPVACSNMEHDVMSLKRLLQKQRFQKFGTSSLERAGHWDFKDSRNGGTLQKADER